MSQAELVELSQPEELEAVFERSHQRPQLIFKHSLICPVSTEAHRAVSRYLEDSPSPEVDYHLIAIQRSRPLSNAVAERVAVRHESPQALLIHEGQAVWNASHWKITAASLTDAIARLP